MSEMLYLRFSGVHFEREAAVTFEAAFGRCVHPRDASIAPCFLFRTWAQKGQMLFWHSLYSIPISILLLILFSPVMLIVAALS